MPEHRPLPTGLILEIARQAGIEGKRHGDKQVIHCPLPDHDDRHASAVLFIERNIFHCSRCTPGRGWTAKAFAAALGVQWPPSCLSRVTASLACQPAPRDAKPAPPPRPSQQPVTPSREACSNSVTAPRGRRDPAVERCLAGFDDFARGVCLGRSFDADVAQQAWAAGLARARDDDRVDQDRDVYEYLNLRGLGEAWEAGLYGIVAKGSRTPIHLWPWQDIGWRIVVPLYDIYTGVLTNVQARAVREAPTKVRTPKGTRLGGTAFANPSALRLLRGESVAHGPIVLGEGLTDLLGLSIAIDNPVVSAPGTGVPQD